jgi:hypothetical protein
MTTEMARTTDVTEPISTPRIVRSWEKKTMMEEPAMRTVLSRYTNPKFTRSVLAGHVLTPSRKDCASRCAMSTDWRIRWKESVFTRRGGPRGVPPTEEVSTGCP